jgi:hypothetical protein
MAANFPQHWEYHKRTLMRCALTVSVSGGATILLFYMALSHRSFDLPAAFAGALFLFILSATPFVIVDSRRVRVVPYFTNQVPGTDTFASGNTVWRHFLFLDQFAKDRGIVPLAAFFSEDDLEGAEVVWHDPTEGLKTVSELLTELRLRPDLHDEATLIMTELSKIQIRLQEASKSGSRFCFLFRHGSSWSGQEMDLRQGFF